MSAFQNQLQERVEIPADQGVPLGQCAGILLKIVDRTQNSTIPAGPAQAWQSRPELLLLDLPQHLTVQTSRHRFHFMPDGRKFTGQLAVTAPGIGHAKGHAHREQPCRVDLFYPGLLWVGKIRKDDPSHGAGQLIQQAAWFSEICIFRILADLRQLRRSQPAAIFPVQDGRHSHLEGRRAGKPAAPEHVAGGIGIEATHRLSLCPEAFRNAPDQTGRMGALSLLRLGLAQVNNIQFVEAPGFDPDKTVVTGGCHCDQIQRHRCRKTIPVLMIGVVAAQLRPARSRVNMHLPPGAIVQLKLFQRGGIPLPLAGQHRRFCAIERAERFVPLPRKDLPSELCTGRHGRSSSTSVLRKVRA